MKKALLYTAVVLAALLGYTQLTTKDSDSIEKGARPDSPDERTALALLKRGGKIDYQKLAAGRSIFKKKMDKQKQLRDAGIQSWEDLGPKNVGGRIRTVVIDPNDEDRITIGAAAGGVWQSTDGGSNWSLRNPSEQAYPVTHLAYDPFDDQTIYGTTGELIGGGPTPPGVGLIKSTNNGLTWQVMPSPSNGANFFWLSKVVMNPLLPNSLYVCGSSAFQDESLGLGIIYRSNDGGQSWRLVYADIDYISDLEINTVDTSELLIGTSTNALVSHNSGFSFTSLTGNGAGQFSNPPNFFIGRRCEVEYCSSDPSVIYVSRAAFVDNNLNGLWDDRYTGLWRSSNGGTTWTNQFVANTDDSTVNPLGRQDWYSHALWVDPNTCNRALLGGINLWKYANNTLSMITQWQDDINGNPATGSNNSVHADFHGIVPYIDYSNTSLGVYLGTDGGLYGSDDVWSATQGNGWDHYNTDLNITQLYGADISHDGDVIVGGSQDNSYFFDVNANNNLQTFQHFSPGDGGYCAVDKSNNSILYTTTQRGAIYRSTNGGTSFCNIARFGGAQFGCCGCGTFTNISDNSLFIAPFKMSPENNTTVFTAGHALYRSTNSGTSWTNIKSSLAIPNADDEISCLDIHRTDDDIIVVGHANGRLYRTVDGGDIWIRIDDNGTGLSGNFVTDVSISPLNDQHLAVTTGGYNTQHIYISTDGGTSWDERPLDFDMHISTVTWHPTTAGWLYVGTDVGVFGSEDNGQTWSVTSVYNQSEGPVYCEAAELFWQGDGSDATPYYLCVATHGRGIWRSQYPIRKNHYVDRLCNPCGKGSFTAPYQTFDEAYLAAGNGSTIIFKTGGTYDEYNVNELLSKRVSIRPLNANVSSIVIK